ncbi:hypothetical protein H4219_001235 [Mycoemilia scoparia]|uniref:Aldose 1-epimerase n=1 Tax=Mycoemilia scoparia TaxID=417184 RepID=A0A9W8A0P4_9FUNG|nr:hypothetical protein H4219_001235 [Mycoemilia scoparia]
MPVSCQAYSKDGSVDLLTLDNTNACMKVCIASYGARIVNIFVNDKNGNVRDVCLGFDSYEDLIHSIGNIDDPYFGAVVGRTAGRIQPCDDIAIEARRCQLPETKPGKVCLHGGKVGFDKKLWRAKIRSQDPPSVQLHLESKDGEEGYPSTLETSVVYTVTDDAELKLEYEGRVLDGSPTIISLTNHVYFSLSGLEEPTILDHVANFHSSQYLQTNAMLVPNGGVDSVKNKPELDFTTPQRIGEHIDSFPKDTLRGYDHTFVIKPEGKSNSQCKAASGDAELVDVGSVWSPLSGIRVTMKTDEPGFVFYTGNWISPRLVGKKGQSYGNYAGFALEASRFPNAIQIPQWKEQVVLYPGQLYAQTTIYKFDTTS